ncbi:MAG TPA: ATP-binding protein [Pirellulales bacterium]|nr:ATP-binding protein [Pirellulales bacterium]
MTVSSQQLEEWLKAKEGQHLEFKEAKNNFHFEKLVKYCAALANEGGGSIVLGVTDRRPRKVVGSQAFADLERTKARLIEKLHLRVEGEEILHPDGRVVVFTAPSRPVGMPIAVEGAYWMRAGEDLAPMTPDMLRRIFDEAAPDFSAEICPKATLADLDPMAIEDFRRRWQDASGNESLAKAATRRLLEDADLISAEGVTYAALILLGKAKALTRYLAQAEVVFEYRSSDAPGPANQRNEYRQGFPAYFDKVWETINLRNDKQHYQEGMVMHAIDTFREGSVREALLNAVSHRDYRHPGSVFVRQFPRRLEIVSPGGFPTGITPDNLIDKQFPRNRRIAETLLRCGLVERSGQGANRMLVEAVRDSKPLPDYARSDDHEVFLCLRGNVQDASFVKFLAQIEPTRKSPLSSHEYLVLDLVRRGNPVPSAYHDEFEALKKEGLIRSHGRGRGARYILNPEFYDASNTPPLLDRDAMKKQILDYLRTRSDEGCPLSHLLQEFHALSRDQMQTLLKELKADQMVHSRGRTKGGRWFFGEEAS